MLINIFSWNFQQLFKNKKLCIFNTNLFMDFIHGICNMSLFPKFIPWETMVQNIFHNYFVQKLSMIYSYKANTPLWLFKGTDTIPSTLTLHVHKTFILQRVSYSICIMPAVVNLVDFSFRISMHFSQPKFPFSGYQKLCWMP